MRTRILVSVATAALLFASCGNEENEVMDNWNGEIRLSSGVAVQQTRANSGDVPDTQIAENQQIGIYVAEVEGEPPVYNGYTNVSAKADGNGGFSNYSTPMYYPKSGKGVSISAYHPYSKDEAGDEYDFVVAEDQSTSPADYYNSDLLYSAKADIEYSKNAHSLTFKHLLSKITCTLNAGGGIGSVKDATVAIVNVDKAVKFNRTTGVVSTPDASKKGDVKLGEYGAIIAPQTISGSTKLLKVTLNGTEYYYTTAEQEIFAAGTLYHYNITVNETTGLTVTSTISPWGTVEDKNVIAEKEASN